MTSTDIAHAQTGPAGRLSSSPETLHRSVSETAPTPDRVPVRDFLTDPALHGLRIGAIQRVWQQLVEARGGTFHPERLAVAQHLAASADPALCSAGEIDAARLRAIPALRRALRRVRGRG